MVRADRAVYLAMIVVTLLVAVPFFWILITSFKERQDIHQVRPAHGGPTLRRSGELHRRSSRNPVLWTISATLIITVATSTAKIVLGVLGAYALSLLRSPGRNLVFIVVIAALMVPNQTTVISNYALVDQMGWRNTYQGIIIPLAGVAFGTFLMRNQFLTLPGEIIEAHRLTAPDR